MIYPRLLLARNLLSQRGVIFISIDVNEQHNLRKICDEVFGAKSFLTDFIWNSRKSVSNDAVVSLNHNYTLVYVKNMRSFLDHKKEFKLKDTGAGFSNPDNDTRGPWKADPFDSPGIRPNLTYEISNPNTGEKFLPPEGRCWRTGPNEYLKLLADNRIVFGKTGKGKPQQKRFLSEAQGKGLTPKSLWDDIGTTTDGTNEIQKIFGFKAFDTPKPVSFIKKIIDLASSKDSIIMDFFSGSSTTAQAMMEVNEEEGSHRKFILVQIPEKCCESSLAYQHGYKTISDIGEERIRRVSSLLKTNNPNEGDQDRGFRVFVLSESNMKDVYYSPDMFNQENLFIMESNIKEDRTDLDLLFGCLLEWGLELSKPYTSEEILGVTIHTYDEDALIACFSEDVPEEVIRAIARRQPLRAIFRDNSFIDDAARVNVEEIFRLLSPDTEVKVL